MSSSNSDSRAQTNPYAPPDTYASYESPAIQVPSSPVVSLFKLERSPLRSRATATRYPLKPMQIPARAPASYFPVVPANTPLSPLSSSLETSHAQSQGQYFRPKIVQPRPRRASTMSDLTYPRSHIATIVTMTSPGPDTLVEALGQAETGRLHSHGSSRSEHYEDRVRALREGSDDGLQMWDIRSLRLSHPRSARPHHLRAFSLPAGFPNDNDSENDNDLGLGLGSCSGPSCLTTSIRRPSSGHRLPSCPVGWGYPLLGTLPYDPEAHSPLSTTAPVTPDSPNSLGLELSPRSSPHDLGGVGPSSSTPPLWASPLSKPAIIHQGLRHDHWVKEREHAPSPTRSPRSTQRSGLSSGSVASGSVIIASSPQLSLPLSPDMMLTNPLDDDRDMDMEIELGVMPDCFLLPRALSSSYGTSSLSSPIAKGAAAAGKDEAEEMTRGRKRERMRRFNSFNLVLMSANRPELDGEGPCRTGSTVYTEPNSNRSYIQSYL